MMAFELTLLLRLAFDRLLVEPALGLKQTKIYLIVDICHSKRRLLNTATGLHLCNTP